MASAWRTRLAVVAAMVLAGGMLIGTSTPANATVDNTGQQDTSFTPAILNGMVRSVVQLKVGAQAGKYLIGGQFGDAGGQTGFTFLARLNSDGTIDTSFTPLTLGGYVWSVVELQVGAQAGKYLIGGEFTNSGYARVARVNTDGSPDTSFTPPSLNSEVRSVAELSNGDYLIGGDFTNSGYVRMARLNAADGTRDTSFTPPTLTGAVNSIAVLKVGTQAGKYLIGGWFENVGADAGTDYVARLDSNGTRDSSFTPLSLNTVVNSVAELSDGKYLIGGQFDDAGGDTGTDNVARLNAADGTRDTSFTPLSLTGGVTAVTALSDGKYLIGGYFENAGGDADTDYVARLNGTDGTRDTTFAPLPLNSFVQSLTEATDGKYLIGGQFSNPGYVNLARLGMTLPSPGFAATPSPLSFSDQNIDKAATTETVTVTNNGTADLVLDAAGVTVTGSDASQFELTGGTCVSAAAVTLAASGQCTAMIAFLPTSVGTKTATLQFATNLPTPIQTVALEGTGIADHLYAPRHPKSVRVAGGPAASRFAVSWVKPSTAGDRPVQEYRVVVYQRGLKKAVLHQTVSGSQTKVKFTRKQLLRHSKLTRGDVSNVLVYRAVVEAVNAAGHSPAATAYFTIRR